MCESARSDNVLIVSFEGLGKHSGLLRHVLEGPRRDSLNGIYIIVTDPMAQARGFQEPSSMTEAIPGTTGLGYSSPNISATQRPYGRPQKPLLPEGVPLAGLYADCTDHYTRKWLPVNNFCA